MKKRSKILRGRIERYLKKEQLLKNDGHEKFKKPYQLKSRKNFTIANLLFNISEQKEFRKLLHLAADFEMYDWVIIVAYYSMYTAALSALASLGYTSKSHAATIAALEYHFVKEKKLEMHDVHRLVKAYTLGEQLITKLIQAKGNRETAQYDSTPSITREMAKTALDDADEFITKIEEILG